jgi:hypothetical protein
MVDHNTTPAEELLDQWARIAWVDRLDSAAVAKQSANWTQTPNDER